MTATLFGSSSGRIDAAQQAGEKAAFKRQVEGLIAVVADHSNAGEHTKHSAKPQRKMELLPECAVIPQQGAAKRQVANRNTGDAGNHSQADEQRDQKAFHLY